MYSVTTGNRTHPIPETFAFLNFYQINSVFNNFNSMLNLIFTNLNLLKVNVVHDPVVPEDQYHPALTIDYPKMKKIPSFHTGQSYFNFSKANYKSITDFFFLTIGRIHFLN